MIEINITRFYNEAAPMDYSASIVEIGANAGREGRYIGTAHLHGGRTVVHVFIQEEQCATHHK